MDLFLSPLEQKPKEPFNGNLDQLKTGLASILAKLDQLLDAYNGPLQLVVVVGHPGTGKTSLIHALEALQLPKSVRTFQVDRYIDWRKVVTYVDSQPGMSASDYLPTANKAALKFMNESFVGKKVIILDGGGLIEDYNRICLELGFVEPCYIVLDASEETVRRRLAGRGDGFTVTEKEKREHNKNLSDFSWCSGVRISTDHADKENPSYELSLVLRYLCRVLRDTTEDDILGPQLAEVMENWETLSKEERAKGEYLRFAASIGIEISPPQIPEFLEFMDRYEERLKLKDWLKSQAEE